MLSDTVGKMITTWRQRRGWNRERLAEECSKAGMPELTHAVLTNIESGRRNKDGARRRTVSVDELTVIAYALNIPPILLLVPYPEEENCEVLPNKEVATYGAVQWIQGIRIFPGSADEIGSQQTWQEASYPLLFLLNHNSAMDAYIRALGDAHEIQDSESTSQELASMRAWEAERIIVATRDAMRKNKFPLPKLPSYAAHLENRTAEDYQLARVINSLNDIEYYGRKAIPKKEES
jgi:transcriptional regulator with XRE-family HTH domain